MAEAIGARVVDAVRLGGGDVAESYRVIGDDGTQVFAKTRRDSPPGFFATEAAGLGWLREPEVMAVPQVIAVGDDPAMLVLEWIDEGARRGDEEAFGRALARLHRAGAPVFGRLDRRPTGSRGLPNDPCDSWVEFYAERRLAPPARSATETGALPPGAVAALEAVAGRLDRLGGPPEPPARLHGDLWAGNRMVDASGRSWLIDPAAHGGHREFDLAMMRLFGGFGDAAFAAYHESFPLADGWRARVPLHQLAPLVTHAIKFGGGYVSATERALAELGV